MYVQHNFQVGKSQEGDESAVFTAEEWNSEVDWVQQLSLEEASLIFTPHAIDSPYQVNPEIWNASTKLNFCEEILQSFNLIQLRVSGTDI